MGSKLNDRKRMEVYESCDYKNSYGTEQSFSRDSNTYCDESIVYQLEHRDDAVSYYDIDLKRYVTSKTK